MWRQEGHPSALTQEKGKWSPRQLNYIQTGTNGRGEPWTLLVLPCTLLQYIWVCPRVCLKPFWKLVKINSNFLLLSHNAFHAIIQAHPPFSSHIHWRPISHTSLRHWITHPASKLVFRGNVCQKDFLPWRYSAPQPAAILDPRDESLKFIPAPCPWLRLVTESLLAVWHKLAAVF